MRLLVSGFVVLLLTGCSWTGVVKSTGDEMSLEEIGRIEAPLESNLQFLANKVDVELSRNYLQDQTLFLPGAGGEKQQVVRESGKSKWHYKAKDGPGFIPLDFILRTLKVKAISRLNLDFPPTTDFTVRIKALGRVRLFLPGSKAPLSGESLVIDQGKVTLDGRVILLTPAMAGPPSGTSR